jgi:hypothetical protein
MIGKIVAAEVGRRVAGPRNGFRGAVIGAVAPWVVRRAFTPLGLAVGGAFVAKRLYDRRKQRARDTAPPPAAY